MIPLNCVPFQKGTALREKNLQRERILLYEQFLIVWKTTFITLSYLPWMLLFLLRTCVTCVMGATPMQYIYKFQWSRITFDLSAKVAHIRVPSIYQTFAISETTRPIELKWHYKKASEYDQDIPQSHATDKATAPWGRAIEHWLSQDIKKTVKVKQPALSSPSRWLQN